MEAGRTLVELAGSTRGANWGAFSPDGQLVVTTLGNTFAGIWDAATGRLVSAFASHTGYVFTVAFSPDSQSLVTTGAEGIRIWQRADQLTVVEPAGAEPGGSSESTSPDGLRIAAVAADGTVALRDAATGAVIASLTVPGEGRAVAVSFTDDSQWVVARTAAGDVVRWRCFSTTAELLAYARDHLPRQLTPAERKRFLLGSF